MKFTIQIQNLYFYTLDVFQMITFNRQTILIVVVSIIFILVPIIGSPELSSGRPILSSLGFQRRFIGTVLVVMFFYLNYFVLIPKYYLTKRYIGYFSSVFICFLIAMSIPTWIVSDEAMDALRSSSSNWYYHKTFEPTLWQRLLWDKTFYEFIISIFTAILLRINIQIHDIEQEKLKTELSYLKAQINPHFLFNTLNSLYALALEKSDDTPDAIIKLSTIMRYVVIESGNEQVLVKKEVDYIKNYIDLQKLRMEARTDFNFEIQGEIADQKIAPLICIPFIENAFKYGLNPDKKSYINIVLEIKPTQLLLFVENTKSAYKIKDNQKSETGIDNTLKRLAFLYPNKHELKISETSQLYSVQLNLQLA